MFTLPKVFTHYESYSDTKITLNLDPINTFVQNVYETPLYENEVKAPMKKFSSQIFYNKFLFQNYLYFLDHSKIDFKFPNYDSFSYNFSLTYFPYKVFGIEIQPTFTYGFALNTFFDEADRYEIFYSNHSFVGSITLSKKFKTFVPFTTFRVYKWITYNTLNYYIKTFEITNREEIEEGFRNGKRVEEKRSGHQIRKLFLQPIGYIFHFHFRYIHTSYKELVFGELL